MEISIFVSSISCQALIKKAPMVIGAVGQSEGGFLSVLSDSFITDETKS